MFFKIAGALIGLSLAVILVGMLLNTGKLVMIWPLDQPGVTILSGLKGIGISVALLLIAGGVGWRFPWLAFGLLFIIGLLVVLMFLVAEKLT